MLLSDKCEQQAGCLSYWRTSILRKYLLGQPRATDNSQLSVELVTKVWIQSFSLPPSFLSMEVSYLVKQSETIMMELRKWHWLRVNLVSSAMTPMSFSAKLLCSWVCCSWCWCLEFFFPRCRTLHFQLFHEAHVS